MFHKRNSIDLFFFKAIQAL
uniref:Uncharacterized protein n=1 Tax=Anguilla anguilla TaxID=7936 RepID=A0A0E9XFS2_ANGAN